MATFIHPAEVELTSEKLLEFIRLHQAEIPRYEQLKKQYMSKPPILGMEQKETWKPDNRLVSNFGRYLVETFNGYFTGIPVKVAHDDKELHQRVNTFWNLNDMDDTLYELSKITSLYGHGFLYVWQDEQARTRTVYNDPFDMFVIYDDTIERRPIYAVRYQTDEDGALEGELTTLNERISFTEGKDGVVFGDVTEHYYPTLPVIEFVENEEHQSLIEPVESLINAYNKALSEKANDVDYFADAYLAILGAELDEEGTYKIRDNRLINIFGTDDAAKIVVEFLDKPDGDTTQENLLDRLERLIYQLSMIANINDESFGNASGVALEFKLQPMKNLAAMKERKFTSGLNRLMQLFTALPTNVPSSAFDEWANIHYRFTRNIPRNVQDEAETAGKLDGIVSKKTQLSVLSVVDNVDEEIALIEAENAIEPVYDFQVGETS